jgi:ketosteroid isomerase-like protein
MHAHSPEELPLVFERYFNARDVAGLMAYYYAPSATYAPLPGETVYDRDVEPAIAGLVGLGHRMDVALRDVLHAGDTALLIVDWEIGAIGLSGTATDVARLQEDGTWRCIIDNPHGTLREVTITPAGAPARP